MDLEYTLPNRQVAASLTSRGKHMRRPFWSRAWQRVTWLTRLSGLILPPSMLERGAEQWIASCRATRANRTALPGERNGADDERFLIDQVIRVFDDSGATRLFRENVTGNAEGQLAALSPHWSNWVAALRLESSRRQKSGQATDASDSSSWPTATAAPDAPNLNSNQINGPTSLGEAARDWQTPATNSFRSRGGDRKDEQGLDQTGEAVENPNGAGCRGSRSSGWRMPRAGGGRRASGPYDRQTGRLAQTGLPQQAELWATPQARDHMPAHSAERIAAMKAEGHGMRNLNDEAELWATPQARDHGTRLADGNRAKRKAELGWTIRDWNAQRGPLDGRFQRPMAVSVGGVVTSPRWQPTMGCNIAVAPRSNRIPGDVGCGLDCDRHGRKTHTRPAHPMPAGDANTPAGLSARVSRTRACAVRWMMG